MSAWYLVCFLFKWNCTWYYKRQVNRRHCSFLYIAEFQVQIVCPLYLPKQSQSIKILGRAPALAPQALYFGYNIMSLLQSTHTILKFLSILGYEPSNRHWLDKSTSLKNRKWMSAWSLVWFLSKWNCTWYYERQVNRRHSSFLYIAEFQVQIICLCYIYL